MGGSQVEEPSADLTCRRAPPALLYIQKVFDKSTDNASFYGVCVCIYVYTYAYIIYEDCTCLTP